MLPVPRGRFVPLAVSLLVTTACFRDGGLLGPEEPLQVAAKGGKPIPPPPPPPLDVCNFDRADAALAGWTQVFGEEFSGNDELFLGQWTIWQGGAWNEELQMYQEQNLSLAGGVLAIVARKEVATGPTNPFDPTPKTFEYTSGRIESIQHFSASPATPQIRLAARLKLAPGYGMWPAFWSYGDPWPTQGEIDIMEARGQEPLQYHTAYWWGRRAGINQTRGTAKTIPTATDLTACWHVYEVIWARDQLTFLLDGNVVDVKTGGNIPDMFGKSQRITLNLAVGGLFFSNLDQSRIETGTYYVDWVRAYAGP